MQSHRFFIAPFLPASYYLVLKAWLTGVEQPLALDARELVNCAQIEDSDTIAFAGPYELALWVRENDAGKPNLLSHVTFNRYFEQLMLEQDGSREPCLRPVSGQRATYQIQDWPAIAGAGVIYKPRAYLHNLWPVRLGHGARAARAALLALFDVMTQDTPERAPGPVTRPITLQQIKARAAALLPRYVDTRQIGSSLRQLEQLGLITELSHSNHNTTYCLNLAAFDRPSQLQPAAVAAACGLDPVHSAVWVELVCAFLAALLKPEEQAAAVWKQIRQHGRDLASEEDARRVIALLQQRRGQRSSGIARVLRDYRSQQASAATWLNGRSFVLDANPSGFGAATGVSMPPGTELGDHLQATQLLLSLEPAADMATAAELLAGSRLLVWQAPNLIVVTEDLRLRHTLISGECVLDCNSLHGRLDYARPFVVLLFSREAQSTIRLTGRFRARRTSR